MSVVTTATSRRNLLAGAIVAAATLPIAPPVCAGKPDADLLAHGRKLDDCVRAYKTACTKYRPLWDERRARMQDEPRRDGEDSMARYTRIYQAVGLEALDAQGAHPDDIMARSDLPSRAILAIPATTLAGLAVKARLAKFGASHIWEASDDDAEWDHLVLRNLVDAVLELAAAQSEKGAA